MNSTIRKQIEERIAELQGIRSNCITSDCRNSAQKKLNELEWVLSLSPEQPVEDKTVEECKQGVAIGYGYDDFEDLIDFAGHDFIYKRVIHNYANQERERAVREALSMADLYFLNELNGTYINQKPILSLHDQVINKLNQR